MSHVQTATPALSPANLAPAPICPYCQQPAELDDGTRIYGHTRFGPLWVCADYPECNAYVGCHPASSGYAPLGRLADPKLRRAKMAAHAALDPLWRAKMHQTGCTANRARGLAYKWLATQMGMTADECHIAKMDIEQCQRVIGICRPFGRRRDRP